MKILTTCFINPIFPSVLFFTFLSPQVLADPRDDSIRSRLADFDRDPAAFMERLPERTLAEGALPAIPALGNGVSSYDLINAELDRLGETRSPEPASRPERWIESAPIGTEDRAENLVDRMSHRTLEEIESARLRTATLSAQPWSDSYWPINNGVIAWRYGDPGFPGSDWKTNSAYLLNGDNSCSVDQLSPAEKYDLLVGDDKKTLTRKMVNEGKTYYDRYGTVEAWMGICHGWAPASYMARRPVRSVEVPAADGHESKIRFYPSDLKALTSLLWANGHFRNRFIGLRCENKNPPKDENGRVLDPACNGENPATWHLSVVNQVGVSKRSFVMNALHDTEIWNQPIYKYEYTYFNPETKEPVTSLAKAEVSKADFKSDKFKRYRAREAQSMIGIAMDLTYIAETSPSNASTDSPERDAVVTVHYLYDLELDQGRKIVGGEWYSSAHPGFLWTPVRNARAISMGDEILSQQGSHTGWNGKTPIPTEWKEAISYSSRNGQPLGRIVETLSLLETFR